MRRVGWLKCSSRARPLHEFVYREPIRIWKRYETSRPTKKNKQSLGGELWNSGRSSSAASVSSPLSREKVSVASASRFPARRATTSSTAGFLAWIAGKCICWRAGKKRKDSEQYGDINSETAGGLLD